MLVEKHNIHSSTLHSKILKAQAAYQLINYSVVKRPLFPRLSDVHVHPSFLNAPFKALTKRGKTIDV